MAGDRFSRLVFFGAAIYGVGVLAPGFFTEKILSERMPPAITHPEFYYGFFGVALAWQVAFLIIAGNPAKFRSIIPVAILEKLAYAIPCAVLLALGRVSPVVALGGGIDFLFAVFFTIAYIRLKPSMPAGATANR